jgi:PAS domain S-box-containing protein
MPLTAVVMLAQEVEMPDRAVIATNAAGEIIYWGDGATRMYGWTREEVMGRVIVDVTPSELSRDLATSILETLRSGHPWSGEFQVRGKEGNRFEARVTDIPVHDNAGELIGIVGISRRTGYLDR